MGCSHCAGDRSGCSICRGTCCGGCCARENRVIELQEALAKIDFDKSPEEFKALEAELVQAKQDEAEHMRVRPFIRLPEKVV